MLIKPRRPRLSHKYINLVYVFGFLYTFVVAGTIYYNSSLIESLVGPLGVTLSYSFISLVILGMYLIYPRILNYFGSLRVCLTLLSLNLISLFFISLLPNSSVATVLGIIIHLVIVSLIALSVDVLIESSSDNKHAGSARGTYLSIINIAAAAAPFIAGFVALTYGTREIYKVAAIILIPAIIILGLHLHHFKDNYYQPIDSFKTLRNVIIHPSLRSPFALQILLQGFFATMVIYSPLYLIQQVGLDVSEIGTIMSLVLIAFVLIELPVGKLLDSHDPKPFIITGSSIIAVALTIFAITPLDSSLIIWIAILFLSRIGAAIIETTSESTFFARVESSDTEAIEVFRLIQPFCYLVIPILVGTLSIWLSISNIFIVLAFMIFVLGLAIAMFTTIKNPPVYRL